MTTDAVRFWDRVSTSSRAPERLGAVARKTIEASRAYLSEDRVVLDVGCGSGGLTTALAPHVRSIHAIDGSAGMIDAARARAEHARAPNVRFSHARLSDVVGQDGAFDVVTMFNVLHYVDDVPEAARRIGRLLAPGGLFLSSTACLGDRWSVPAALTWTLAKLHLMPATHFFEQTELTSLIARGGLEIVATKQLSALPEHFVVARRAA